MGTRLDTGPDCGSLGAIVCRRLGSAALGLEDCRCAGDQGDDEGGDAEDGQGWGGQTGQDASGEFGVGQVAEAAAVDGGGRLRVLVESSDYHLDGSLERGVFPDADHSPTCRCEMGASVRIAVSVGFDLRGPPVLIRTGPGPVLGTAVPEAPIEKHGYLATRKCDVDRTARLSGYFVGHAVAEAARMQGTSERTFTLVAMPRQRRHAARDFRAGGTGMGWHLERLRLPGTCVHVHHRRSTARTP